MNGSQGKARWRGWQAAILGCLLAGACAPRGDAPELVCSSSYLEAAASDVLNRPAAFFRLAEPGTCPGHFDIRPSQAAALRRSRLLLRFDFQNSLDHYLGSSPGRQTRIGEVTVQGGMCVPSNYLSVCRQVAAHLAAMDPASAGPFPSRLVAIEQRLSALEISLREEIRAAGLAGAPVVASRRQRDFCEWLGLRVVADFTGADIARPSELERAVAAGRDARAKAVIANLPEGRKAADFIAGALGAKVVVWGNFPLPAREGADFDALLRDNVRELVKELRQP